MTEDIRAEAAKYYDNRWGGYAGEPYGAGPELIIEFVDAPPTTRS